MKIAALIRNAGLGTLLAGAATLAFASTANAQILWGEDWMRMTSPADEYLFFEDDKKTVVDYKSERVIRVCVTENRHMVPMSVTYDDKKGTVRPGDCMRVEAAEVTLEPAKKLDPNWALQARVETLE